MRRAAQLRGVEGGRARRWACRSPAAEAFARAVASACADGAGACRARARTAGARALRARSDAFGRLASARLFRHARGAARRGGPGRARAATARAEPAPRAGDHRPRGFLVAPLPFCAARTGAALPAPRVARRPFARLVATCARRAYETLQSGCGRLKSV